MQNEKKYFHVSELVPPWIFKLYGEERSWNFVNKQAFTGLRRLRMYVGKPFTINNYKWGGEREWSGFRTVESPDYSPTSQHSFANAYDVLVRDMCPRELQYVVKRLYRIYNIGGLEEQETWTHLDWRFNLDGKLTVF